MLVNAVASGKRTVLLVAIAAFALASGGGPLNAQDRLPGREICLPSDEIKDPFLSFVVGVVRTDTEFELDSLYLTELFGEYAGASAIPFEEIEKVSRRRSGISGRDQLSIDFKAPISYPIPFSILGYHPGSMLTSQELVLRAVDALAFPSAFTEAFGQSGAYVYEISQGFVFFDLDRWLDILLGKLLDDILLRAVIILTYRGDWHGLLSGYSNSGRMVSGAFNLRRNRIVFPVPATLREAGTAVLRELAYRDSL